MPEVRGNPQGKNRIPELDYLRGFAALSVVTFHYFFKGPTSGYIQSPTFGLLTDVAGYGYLGVNLFFIISGFVIAMSLENVTALEFFKARAIRLFPAMWVCATITAIAIAVLTPKIFPLSNWLASLTLVPEWLGYSGVDSAYWSLRIEVQFYLAVGLFIALGRFRSAPLVIGIWLTASAANLVFPIWRLDFLLCLTWAPYLCAGILFYNWYSFGLNRLSYIGLLFSLVLCIGYGFKSATKDGYEIAWISCFIIVIFFAVFTFLCVRKSCAKSTTLSQFLGVVTYPLYLLHQTLGYAIFDAVASASRGLTQAQSLIVLSSVFTAMIAATYAVQGGLIRMIDRKLRFLLYYDLRK